MPASRFYFPRILLLTFLMLGSSLVTTSAEPVTIITDGSSMLGNLTKEGATEMAVLMQVAQLKFSTTAATGVVGVGNQFGRFSPGTQRALELAVHQGIPVVRLARHGGSTAPATGHCLFIDSGTLAPQVAADLLNHCLTRFGPLPPDPTSPDWQLLHNRYRTAFAAAIALPRHPG